MLAKVNTEKLEAQAAQARAALQSAEAKQLQSEATLAEAEAELARLQHVRELSGGRVPSKQEMDSQEASVKRARADQASIAAQVAQSQASLTAIETDIRKAIIRSPISGIVLDRQIDPGQTVAASFQTPTLFTLAQDLTKMKLIVDVDEADIGNVHVGQRRRFRVDAYPDRIVLVAGQRSAQHAEDVERRRDLSNGAGGRQLRAPAPARYDRDGGDHRDDRSTMRCSSRTRRCASRRRRRNSGQRAAASGCLPRPPGPQRRDRSLDDGQPRVGGWPGDRASSRFQSSSARPTAA